MQPDSPYLRLAEPYLREAITVGSTPGSVDRSYELANSYYFQAMMLEANEQLPQAVLLFDKAIRLGKQSRKTGKWAYAFLNQALDYYKLGDYERCIQKARLGSHYYGQRNDLRSQAQCSGLEAMALGTMNQVTKAAQLLALAIRQISLINAQDMDLGDYYVQLGDLQGQLNQPQAAMASFQKAISNFSFHKDAQGIAVYSKIGYLHLNAFKDTLIARTCFQRVIRQAASSYQRAKAYTGMGDISRSSKHYKQALQYYQRGLQTLPINFTPSQLTHNPSASSVKIAAHKAYLLTLIQNKADTWLAWATNTANRQYLTYALQTYQLADQMIDFMRWEQTGQQSKLYWRQQTHSLYERAIETSFRVGNAQQAYHFIEKSRAVILADKINELGARQHLAPELATLDYQIRQRTTNFQNQLGTQSIGTLAYRRTRLALLNEQERLDSLIHELETTNGAYYRYKYTNVVTPLPQVQQWLEKRDASLLSFFVGESAVYIVGVTPAGVQLHSLPVRRYAQTVQPFMRLLATNSLNSKENFSRLLVLANGLYQQVVQPFTLPPGRVIVSSDGEFIPFETLSRSPFQADYLVKQYAFSYTYSVQGLLKGPSVQKARYAYLGMAPVQFNDIVVRYDSGYNHQSQPVLTGSETALIKSSSHYKQSVLLTGAKATRLAFQQNAHYANVVQLFTHADAITVPDSTGSVEPTIFFADSALRLSEMQASQNVATQLIILMACKTGLGINQKGEGVFSMARGFASLGVSSILTTLWSVENLPTYRLAELFHDQLAKGLPKDLALQQAKLQFLDEASMLEQLPSHWAGIILIGNTDPLPSSSQLWLWLIGILVISAISGSWFFFRKKT
ncbi:CHAT domain-containing protein [Spirosoma validum]|uniref:CHAT domain-containing protein n=1 Tax=Spirosoma validum TaxID=2771355 RepID=A0A927B1L6_9BACT|nr:CHAT domain-containing tetratricopeptide repeat protein [Spirosoma validum]MBD2753905.1 CHAT domain-containing protein [Spirosoma validum]